MKTFNKEDLITWSNRHDVNVGDKGYFADSITDLHSNMMAGYVHELMSIFDNNNRCFSDGIFSYGFFLPVECVKEEKKYRACKNIKEFYELVNDYGSDSFPNDDFTTENFIYNLLDSTIHIRSKVTGTEYYTAIITITVDVDVNNYVKIALSPKSYQSFNELFENYEIEINGEWCPFGVINED